MNVHIFKLVYPHKSYNAQKLQCNVRMAVSVIYKNILKSAANRCVFSMDINENGNLKEDFQLTFSFLGVHSRSAEHTVKVECCLSMHGSDSGNRGHTSVTQLGSSKWFIFDQQATNVFCISDPFRALQSVKTSELD